MSPGLRAGLHLVEAVPAFMAVVGMIEIAVGAAILGLAPKLGAYVASAWLLLVAVNLAIGGYFDVAVRDVVMAVAAFTLARGLEMRAASEIRDVAPVPARRSA